jgi:hypothetical protein
MGAGQLRDIGARDLGLLGRLGEDGRANYGAVSTERTGHAEAIRITYDPRQLSYATLLRMIRVVIGLAKAWARVSCAI